MSARPAIPFIPVVRAAAIVVSAIGVSVLIGWAFNVMPLKTMLPGLVTMKANTALCFLCSGVTLWLAVSPRDDQAARIARVAAPVLVAIVALATIFEYAAGLNIGIDQMLVKDPGLGGQSIPGRMSIVTAVEFTLFAASIFLTRNDSAAARIAFVATTTLGALISLLAVVGYAYAVPALYQSTKAAAIAVHTAIAFIALFGGALSLRTDLGWVHLLWANAEGGVFIRRLLPAVVIGPLVLGLITLALLRAQVLDAAMAIATFALANVAVLGAIVWISADNAQALGRTLQRRERIFDSFLANALDAMIISDQQGRVMEWNPEAERMFGRTRQEMLGRVLRDEIWPERDRERNAKAFADLRAGGQSERSNRRVEVQMLRRDGTPFPAEIIIVPIQLDGELVLCSFARDLTEIKVAEEQLRQAQKMEAVGQLTGGIAHDFNNLLTVVISMVDSSMSRVDENVRQRLDLALKAADRGATLIRQMLAYSRRQVLNPTAINLSDVARGVEEVLKRTIGEQIEIALRLDAELPNTLADRSQVENALLNLAINARDAMPKGGKLTIETKVVALDAEYASQNLDVIPGRYVMLAVSDTGAGMTTDVLSRAIEPFFSTKDVGKGSGLGLSMIHGFARQSDGHLKIYSEVGHGTSVRLYLPLIDAGAGQAHAADDETAPLGAGEKILVVEDDPHARQAVVQHLIDLGYQVTQAEHAAAALTLITGGLAVDLLFTDMVMPGGISGRDLAEQALLLRPNLLVLYTSGYTDNTIVHHGKLDPGVHFLPKPYRVVDLARKVHDVLRPPRLVQGSGETAASA